MRGEVTEPFNVGGFVLGVGFQFWSRTHGLVKDVGTQFLVH